MADTTTRLSLDVIELLDEAMARSEKYPGDRQDKYPVIVETTERHLVWVEADSLKDAVESLSDDPEWYEAVTPANRIEGGYSYQMEAPEDHSWDWEVYGYDRVEGPRQACTECKAVAHSVRWGLWHKDTCPQRPDLAETPKGGAA